MSDHIVKSYDRDLENMGRRISEMGGLAEKMLADSMDALTNLDSDLAHRVIAADHRLDALHREIEEIAILTIARRQPLAVDLRECIAAIRISGDIERILELYLESGDGNHGERVGRRSLEMKIIFISATFFP